MEEKINKAIEVLRNGGVILYPTDTIWGIGCDATNDDAVQKIFDIKKREDSKSLIVLLESDKNLNRYIRHIPDAAWDIFDFATKPTTLILDGAYNVSKKAIAKDGSLGIRICKAEPCNQIIRKLNRPLVSTSANVTGHPSPANFEEISDVIQESVDYILDLPELYQSREKASSIIKLDKDSTIQMIRP